MVKTILKSSTFVMAMRRDHQFWGTELQETARFIDFVSPDHGLELRSWLCTWTLSWKAPAFLELVARTNAKNIAMVRWDPSLNVRSCSHVKPTNSIQSIDPSLCVGSLNNISTYFNRIQVEPSKHLVNWHIEERPEGIPSQVNFNKALASREQSWKIRADLP